MYAADVIADDISWTKIVAGEGLINSTTPRCKYTRPKACIVQNNRISIQ